MCGIMGVYGHPEAAKLAYLGGYALQHRGEESAGICVSNGERLLNHARMGLVSDVFNEQVLSELTGYAAIGHNRYSTAGASELRNAQPFLVDCGERGQVAICHNGNFTNYQELKKRLDRHGAIFISSSDTEVVLHLLAASKIHSLVAALKEVMPQIEGAGSLLILTKDCLVAVRDPYGFRPLVIGSMLTEDGHKAWVFASETCALDLIAASYEGEVAPGEIVIVGRDGMYRERFDEERNPSSCVFEHVYFARPDSIVFGQSVSELRELMGLLLAREHPVAADIVVPVPDSGVPAAIGYAEESGLPYRMALVRNHYVGRTFIEPKQAIRDFGVKLKLNPVRSLINGKRVVLVDDSVVRGTTSKIIVRMVREAGAREVHLRISCPPTISPCHYGIDTPTSEELIGSSHSVEEIRWYVEADSLGYLSMEGLRQAVGDLAGSRCYSCWTGRYPTPVPLVQIGR